MGNFGDEDYGSNLSDSPQPVEDIPGETFKTTTCSRTFTQKNLPKCIVLKTSQDESKCNNGTDYLAECENGTTQAAATLYSYNCDSNSKDHLKESSENIPTPSPANIIINENKRTRRVSKRRRDIDLQCPVCGITLRPQEMNPHFAAEVEKLERISRTVKKPPKNYDGINNTFVKVRSNRENRLSAKVSKYTEKAKNEIQCHFCKVRMTGNLEEMSKHVALCAQHEEENEEYVVVEDDDDSQSFEEYEIGNETRIRTVSLIPGGHRSLQGSTTTRNRSTDEDLDVDIDDTMAFGQPQYTEMDVIPNAEDEHDEFRNQLRKAVINDPSIQPQVLESRKWSEDAVDSESKTDDSKISCDDQIISSLKEKIKDMVDQTNIKCLICLEPYTKPVVSTTCWHVHCEECWLMTMGVKKLCPQCNMIVFPTDLRKIFL